MNSARLITVAMAAMLLHAPSDAANGFSVAANFHAPSFVNPPGWFLWAGPVVRYDIVNNKVTGIDTIAKAPIVGQQPQISFDGTRVAFYRFGWQVEKHSDGKYYLIESSRNAPCYISVVNKDGSGLRNILQLPVNGSVGKWGLGTVYGYGWDNQLEWPAGEWIYYLQPNQTGIIRRVNAISGADELVVAMVGSNPAGNACYWRRWSLSADAKWMGYQTECGGANAVGGSNFPPPNGRISDCPSWIAMPACNGSISTSGQYVANFGYEGHSQVFISRFPKNQGRVSCCMGLEVSAISIPNIQKWTGRTIVAADGGGSEWIRWSANSDKWYSRMVMYCFQSNVQDYVNNQAIVNWIDSVAIVTSDNRAPGPCPSLPENFNFTEGSSAGEVWIDNPAQNPQRTKMELIDGSWVEVPGATPWSPTSATTQKNFGSSALNIHRCGSGIRVSAPWGERCDVEILDLSGRTLSYQRVLGGAEVALPTSAGGIVIVRASSPSGSVALPLSPPQTR
jgi:hypothetical protein